MEYTQNRVFHIPTCFLVATEINWNVFKQRAATNPAVYGKSLKPIILLAINP